LNLLIMNSEADEFLLGPYPKKKPLHEGQAGLPGKALFRDDKTLQWYLIAITTYALGGLAFAIYVSRCPYESNGVTALASWNWKVDSLYSGLALAGVLVPLAIMIQKVSRNFALLQPFAIASKQPVEIRDLDSFMRPGFRSTLRLLRYSPLTALVQAYLLLAGAVVVPLGMLVVFTGTRAAITNAVGTVGMPIAGQGSMGLSADMESAFRIDNTTNHVLVASTNAFLPKTASMFFSSVIQQDGVPDPAPQWLGPSSASNLTYKEGVRYNGIVAFTWSSGCQYTNAITYTESMGQDLWTFDIKFPTGDEYGDLRAWASQLVSANQTDASGNTTMYYAIVGAQSSTTNFQEASVASAVTTVDGAWISRVVCTPKMNWQVSSCVWSNSSMTNCQATPNQNTTALDTDGLDKLTTLMGVMPMMVADTGSYSYGLPTVQTALMLASKTANGRQYRAPMLADFDKMYGLAAQSIAYVATSGYYGLARVPTVDSEPKPAYLVRNFVLVTLVSMIVLVPILTQGLLFWNRREHVPMRRATFLTVANAVRGPWWDDTLKGGCVMPDSKLRRRHVGLKVMFGVDVSSPSHVGFAKEVLRVQRNAIYEGLSAG
jgi:hypothetical protein